MKNLKMLNPLNFISKIFKSNNQYEIDKIKPILEKVNHLEKDFYKLHDEEFPKKTAEFKKIAQKLVGPNVKKHP